MTLTPGQHLVIDRYGKARQAMAHYHNRPTLVDGVPTELESDPLFWRAFNEHDSACTAVIRAGLLANPLVRILIQPWLESLGGNGDRDVLRRIQRGLETGVRRPLRMQLRPTADDAKMIALRRQGDSLRQIVSKLPKLGIKHMSHTAVGKRLAMCGSVKGKRSVKRKTIL